MWNAEGVPILTQNTQQKKEKDKKNTLLSSYIRSSRGEDEQTRPSTGSKQTWPSQKQKHISIKGYEKGL